MIAADRPPPAQIYVCEPRGRPVEAGAIASPFRIGAGGLETRTAGADYIIVDRLGEADVAALPLRWHAYGEEHRHEAIDAIARCRRAGVETIVWVDGDHEADIAEPGVIQYQHAAARDRPGRLPTVRCYPPFFSDPVPEGRPVARAATADRPLIGFCGQARQRPGAGALLLAGKIRDRLRHRVGWRDSYPQPLSSHIRLRRRALRVLAESHLVETDFTVRDRYRAGVLARSDRNDPADPSNLEFSDNIRRTDYTLCVRGGGNYSNRLFEAMARGRIPVIVDSGSMMPCENEVDWRELAVVVDENDLADLPERLARRHEAVGPAGVQDWQRRCRAAWVEWLSLEGFFSRFGSTVTEQI